MPKDVCPWHRQCEKTVGRDLSRVDLQSLTSVEVPLQKPVRLHPACLSRERQVTTKVEDVAELS